MVGPTQHPAVSTLPRPKGNTNYDHPWPPNPAPPPAPPPPPPPPAACEDDTPSSFSSAFAATDRTACSPPPLPQTTRRTPSYTTPKSSLPSTNSTGGTSPSSLLLRLRLLILILSTAVAELSTGVLIVAVSVNLQISQNNDTQFKIKVITVLLVKFAIIVLIAPRVPADQQDGVRWPTLRPVSALPLFWVKMWHRVVLATQICANEKLYMQSFKS